MDANLLAKEVEKTAKELERYFRPEQIQELAGKLEKNFTDFPKEVHISPRMEEAINDLIVETKIDPIHVIAFLMVKNSIKLVK